MRWKVKYKRRQKINYIEKYSIRFVREKESVCKIEEKSARYKKVKEETIFKVENTCMR